MNEVIKWDITNNACTALSQQQMSLDFHTGYLRHKTAGSVGALFGVLLLGFQQSSPVVWKRDEQLELGPSTLLNCNACME